MKFAFPALSGNGLLRTMVARCSVQPCTNKLSQQKALSVFERLEPRVLLSADLLGGVAANDLLQEDEQLQSGSLIDGSDISELVAPFLQDPDRKVAVDELPASALDLAEVNSLYSDYLSVSAEFGNPEPDALELAEFLPAFGNDGELRQEIVFVDPATPDYESLIADIAAGDSDVQYLVFMLDADRDGAQQITEVLSSYTGIDALQIVSHGTGGTLQLGNTTLTQASFQQSSELFSDWQAALDESADLLIYGCDLAATEPGVQLLDSIARATGADVAASDDLTGHTALGGDWELERQIGQIETQIAFSASFQQQWQNTLNLLAYESFSYAPGALHGQAGGIGWATGWTTPEPDSAIVTSTGLSDPTTSLPVAGGAAEMNNGSGTFSQVRDLSNSIGTDGTTVWMSFLLQADNVSTGELSLEIGDNTNDRVTIGYSGDDFLLTKNRLGGTQIDNVVSSGTTYFLAARIDFAPVADTVTLYVDPTPGLLVPDSLSIVQLATAELGMFTQVGIVGGFSSNNAAIDEIRVGDSYEAVAPGSTLPVNTDPVHLTPIPDQAGTAGTPFSFSFDANTFTDLDSGDTLSYSASLAGGLPLPSWLSFDSASRSFSGTPGAADVGTITIEVSADDGNGGTPATDQFDLQVGIDSGSLFFSTADSATDDNAAIVGNGDIVAFTNPALELEFGDGNSGSPTEGTINVVDTLPENVRALHIVGTSVTVDTFIGGSAGTYVLQQGQVVLSMRGSGDFDLPTVGGGNISVGNTDVLVYTPSTGEYEYLLQDAILEPDASAANIYAISIVEQETTVGVNTTLTEGTYLIARSGPSVHANISTYDAVNGLQDLLLGVDFLTGASAQIQGLELIERPVEVGGINLSQGTLLATLKSTGAQTAGTSGATTAAVENVDIVALTINATELDAAPANVDANILFDGSDVGLIINSSKEINGLSVTGAFATNSAPSGSVTIAGNAEEDSTLSASNDLADSDGMGAVSYQWQRDGVDITGATGSDYTLQDADVGSEISVIAKYVDGNGKTESKESAPTAEVTGINDAPTLAKPGTVFINEIHYDNIGVDFQEGIEIAGVAGTDLRGWSLALYDGLNGEVYYTQSLSGLIPNEVGGFGAVAWVGASGDVIQNGTSGNPDGIALVDNRGNVVQFLSYEGSFTATEGPAAGMTSTDIGVQESNLTTLIGSSLQLKGSTAIFSWSPSSADSFGTLNAGQDIAALAQATHQSVVEDQDLVFSTANGNSIDIEDVDAGQGNVDPIYVQINAINGTLSPGPVTTGLAALSGAGTTTLSFTGSVSEINTALDGLTFTPTQDYNGGAAISIFVDDQGNSGSGGDLQTGGVVYINVTADNDDPTLDNAIADRLATEDTAFSYTFNANSFGDVDGDTLTYSATLAGGAALPSWLSFDANSRTFSGIPMNGDVGFIDVEVTAGDGKTGSTPATDTFRITVANTNDDPTLDNAIPDQSATEDTAFTFTFNANTFGDVDVGDTLTYSAELAGGGVLPGWLSFDANTRTFSGTPLNGDVGFIDIEVTADDGQTGSTRANDIFRITVGNSNDNPTLDNAIADQTATEDTAFSFTFNASTFGDADGDTLTYSATLAGGGALPGWLSFDANTRTFSGTPLNGDVGFIDVEVTADDSQTGSTPATDAFRITIGNTNDDPTLDNAIPDQSATEDSAFSFTFNANTFGDVDASDTLTYSATLANGDPLPGWLDFDPNTRTFSGTPLNGDVGFIDVEVTADDSQTGSTPATDTFRITIGNTNDAPEGKVELSSNSPSEGEILTATLSITDDDGLGVLNYQWQRNGVDIAGATASSYKVSIDDVNSALSLVVSYEDGYGQKEKVISDKAVFFAPPPEPEPPTPEPSEPDPEPETGTEESGDDPAAETEPEVQPDSPVDTNPDQAGDEDQDETSVIAASVVQPDVSLDEDDSENSDANAQTLEIDTEAKEPQQSVISVELRKLQANYTPYNDPLTLVQFGSFVDAVDQLREDIAENALQSAPVIGSTFAVSAGMSAGYIAWLARSGAILGSVMSAMPMWRFIDPLPVLNGLGNDDEDGESLQSMIDKSQTDDPDISGDSVEEQG